MYIIVVGAGEVGSYVADRLSGEGHDIVVIERDASRSREIAGTLDVYAVCGSGTSPRTLTEAGIDKADLVVAVTSDDEVNLITSLLAKQNGVARTVVRIEDPDLRAKEAAELRAVMGADLVIDPDEETAEEIQELLEYPGASEVAVMAGGEVIVIGARLEPAAPLVGRTLHEVAQEYEPEWDFLFGSISRNGEMIIPRGNQRFEAHDLVRVVCKRKGRRELARLLGLVKDLPHRVVLLGGGRTAELLANRLSGRGVNVVVVERDVDRAQQLAERLHHALILQGEVTDADLLEEIEIDEHDIVVALTGEDDANVLACLYARQAGAEETIAVVHRLSLLPLLREAGVDAALSPRTASANGVLRFVRGGVAQVATFLEGEAEVLELEVLHDSPADGTMISKLRLPKDVLIGAIVRDGRAFIGRGHSVLRERDHVVVFAVPSSVDTAKKIFG